ncbi:hypothetical protein [Bradyrhizobium sp. BWA-3-5]|uniref:hypothetical protein n=1 Tax=Bradyrhizobium sp. BWA-3-5 TaxID=3080013 RepID=UPI00293EF331|nr:hypothetical protein [Bradyrhizobium sp. BWA-3-5]WOH63642.1 hypothetical protein RX331_23305 [Bradyrhizobium sp. BWA-3-5]
MFEVAHGGDLRVVKPTRTSSPERPGAIRSEIASLAVKQALPFRSTAETSEAGEQDKSTGASPRLGPCLHIQELATSLGAMSPIVA